MRKIARSPLFAKLTRTSAKFSIFKFYFNVSNQFRHFWLSPPNGDTFQIQTNTPPRHYWLILILHQPLQFVLFALRNGPVIHWLPHAISNVTQYFWIFRNDVFNCSHALIINRITIFLKSTHAKLLQHDKPTNKNQWHDFAPWWLWSPQGFKAKKKQFNPITSELGDGSDFVPIPWSALATWTAF